MDSIFEDIADKHYHFEVAFDDVVNHAASKSIAPKDIYKDKDITFEFWCAKLEATVFDFMELEDEGEDWQSKHRLYDSNAFLSKVINDKYFLEWIPYFATDSDESLWTDALKCAVFHKIFKEVIIKNQITGEAVIQAALDGNLEDYLIEVAQNKFNTGYTYKMK
jgi:hypothetical protein